jgi:hypothetical protein
MELRGRIRPGIAWAVAGALAIGWLWPEPRELGFDEAHALAASWDGALYDVGPADTERHLELVDRCFHGHDARACATHFHRVGRAPRLDASELPRIGWHVPE